MVAPHLSPVIIWLFSRFLLKISSELKKFIPFYPASLTRKCEKGRIFGFFLSAWGGGSQTPWIGKYRQLSFAPYLLTCLSRDLCPTTVLADLSGLSFLGGYGRWIGLAWKAFLAHLFHAKVSFCNFLYFSGAGVCSSASSAWVGGFLYSQPGCQSVLDDGLCWSWSMICIYVYAGVFPAYLFLKKWIGAVVVLYCVFSFKTLEELNSKDCSYKTAKHGPGLDGPETSTAVYLQFFLPKEIIPCVCTHPHTTPTHSLANFPQIFPEKVKCLFPSLDCPPRIFPIFFL